MEAKNASELADMISEELQIIAVNHEIGIRVHQSPNGKGDTRMIRERVVRGIAAFPSVRDFAAALEHAGADASYSAGSGWSFKQRRLHEC